MKAVRFRALRANRLYPPFPSRKYPWHTLLLEAESTQRHSATESFMSMKNSNDTIGNRTRDFPVCSAVLQPTPPPSVPCLTETWLNELCFDGKTFPDSFTSLHSNSSTQYRGNWCSTGRFFCSSCMQRHM
jgi:hypothetical protein